MSEQIQEPDVNLQTIYREILQIKNDIKALNDRMVGQFAFLQQPLETITTNTKEILDTVQDKAQELKQEEAAATSDPHGFDLFDGRTPRPGDKGKAPQQTTQSGMGLATSSKPSLGILGEPQGIFGSSRTRFSTQPPTTSQTGTPTRGRSPTKARSSSRQSSPAKEKKKKKYKVETPSKLKSIVPKDVKKWLLDVAVWAMRYEDEFDTEQELVLHLFSLLDGELADWGLPFQAKLLGKSRFRPAPIRTIQEFREGILAAFGDPDAERAAARKIVELSQTGTAVEYTTKFRTIVADLNWNEAAYMGQYMRGLHWKVKEILSQRETQPTTLQGLIDAAQRIDAVRRENEESRPKKEKTKEKEKGKGNQGSGSTTKEKVADKENFVDREERDRRRKEGLCIKCSESGHSIKECPNGWRKSKLKKEDKKEVKKESAKVAQDKPEEVEIEAKSGKE